MGEKKKNYFESEWLLFIWKMFFLIAQEGRLKDRPSRLYLTLLFPYKQVP